MVRRLFPLVLLLGLALAQNFRGLSLGTPYPEMGVQPGESVNLTLTLKNYGLPPGVIRLSVAEVPQGWQASLIGGGRLVRAVHLATDGEATLTLRLLPLPGAGRGPRANDEPPHRLGGGPRLAATA
jgi:hypothetical protein